MPALPDAKRIDRRWFYVEMERLSLHERLFAVRLYVFTYVYVRELCMQGDFAHVRDMIGSFLALLTLLLRLV